jgi:hypothetical protein
MQGAAGGSCAQVANRPRHAQGRVHAAPSLPCYRSGARKPLGLSQGMPGLRLDTTRTHVLSYQAGETATLAGETRSPHTPLHQVLAARNTWAPGPAGHRQGATAGRVGVARPVDGPRETALGLRLRTVKCRSRRRKHLRGSGSASPACKRGSLNYHRLLVYTRSPCGCAREDARRDGCTAHGAERISHAYPC